MKLTSRSMYNFLLLPLFFPFVGFFPGADTQPIFLILALVLFVFFSRKIKFNIFFIIIFVISALLIFMRFYIESSQLDFKYVFTYLGALVTFFLIYVLVENGYLQPTFKFMLFVLFSYMIVGIIQIFIPDFMASIVSRSVEHALSYSNTGRGVRSLTGEPTALGKIFTSINIIVVFLLYYSDLKDKHRTALLVSASIFFVSAILSRSAYALIIHILLIILLMIIVNKKLFFILSVFLFFIMAPLLSYLYMYSEVRAVNIIIQLFNQPEALLQQGAMRRVLNIPISFNNLQYFGYFGAGNSQGFFNATLSTVIGPLNYQAFNRNLGGIVEFILKFGVFSIPIISLYFYMLFKILVMKVCIDGKAFRIGIYFACSTFVLTFQDGSPVQPLSWFLLVYFYVYSNGRSFTSYKINRVPM